MQGALILGLKCDINGLLAFSEGETTFQGPCGTHGVKRLWGVMEHALDWGSGELGFVLSSKLGRWMSLGESNHLSGSVSPLTK